MIWFLAYRIMKIGRLEEKNSPPISSSPVVKDETRKTADLNVSFIPWQWIDIFHRRRQVLFNTTSWVLIVGVISVVKIESCPPCARYVGNVMEDPACRKKAKWGWQVFLVNHTEKLDRRVQLTDIVSLPVWQPFFSPLGEIVLDSGNLNFSRIGNKYLYELILCISLYLWWH